MKYVLTALAILSACAPAYADEPISFDVRMAGGALICDTPEDALAKADGLLAPTCGTLVSPKGMMATITIMDETRVSPDGKTYPLAMFRFHEPTPWGNDVQFGFWAGEIPTAGVDL